MERAELKLPADDENNGWYTANDSPTVFVFIHGIFSSSRTCWLYENADPSRNEYWPHLIGNDPRLNSPSVYLGGYYTAIDAGDFDLFNCADEVFRSLSDVDVNGRPGPLSKETIVFVCHSTGGIVARYFLARHWDKFVSKKIGLVLLASPSTGSAWANLAGSLSRFYNQQLGQTLEHKDKVLDDLDREFKDLVEERKIPKLEGSEACENYFIYHRKWIPDWWKVVNRDSAGRYFGACRCLARTDHFSIVKPNSTSHPAHKLLVRFYRDNFATDSPSGAPPKLV